MDGVRYPIKSVIDKEVRGGMGVGRVTGWVVDPSLVFVLHFIMTLVIIVGPPFYPCLEPLTLTS